MHEMTLSEVAKAMNGRLVRGLPGKKLYGISTDTRTMRGGELFFALVGPTIDAHTLLGQARSLGAAAVVVHELAALDAVPGLPAILVDDTTVALGDLAHWHRMACRATTVIGITGSNGKTTVKELLFHILDAVVRSVKSIGNFNNQIGVPLTLFQLRPQDVYAVVEMGTNSPGEIARLCEIAAPQLGILTNIGNAHLEGLGGLDGVAEEKSALLRCTVRSRGAIYNADNWHCRQIARELRGTLLSFGIDEEATFKAHCVQPTENGIAFKVVNGRRVTLPVTGLHNASNALAAIAAARQLGIDWDRIVERLAGFRLPPNRMQRESVRGVDLILDAYNANPDSMTSAGQTLRRLDCSGRRILVAGDMLELGDEADHLHRTVGLSLNEPGPNGARLDYVFGLGGHTAELIAAARPSVEARLAGSRDELAEAVLRVVQPGDVVLFKASRAMKLDEVADRVKRELGAAAAAAEQLPVYQMYRSEEGVHEPAEQVAARSGQPV
jgi:UDP-N-acetylmuramoyl-tripeptide--D-alanyl-D-alanine ligase